MQQVFGADIASMQSINWRQLETRDGDDVGCACVLESFVHFGAIATTDAGE